MDSLVASYLQWQSYLVGRSRLHRNEELHEIRLGGKPFRASRVLGRLAEKSTRARVF